MGGSWRAPDARMPRCGHPPWRPRNPDRSRSRSRAGHESGAPTYGRDARGRHGRARPTRRRARRSSATSARDRRGGPPPSRASSAEIPGDLVEPVLEFAHHRVDTRVPRGLAAERRGVPRCGGARRQNVVDPPGRVLGVAEDGPDRGEVEPISVPEDGDADATEVVDVDVVRAEDLRAEAALEVPAEAVPIERASTISKPSRRT
jgi:hypothetical protein